MLLKVLRGGLKRHGKHKKITRISLIQVRRFNWDLSVPNVSFNDVKELYVGHLSAADSIRDYITRHDLRSVLLIASKSLDSRTNAISKIETMLGNRLKEKITGIGEHNPAKDAFNSIEMAREYNVDCVVCIGGGSVIDNGKMASVLKNEPMQLLNRPEQIDDYTSRFDENQQILMTKLHYDYNTKNYEKANPHTIIVPTTLAGTTHHTGFLSMKKKQKKSALTHPSFMPHCCIFDPRITEYTPKWVWYSTALRGIDHCIETICSQHGNLYWETLALNTLRSYLKYLPMTYHARIPEKTEYNLEYYARLKCLIASLNAIAPIAQGCPMGASHGIGYTMGMLYNTPHGYTSCVLSPCVLRWNLLNDKSENDFVKVKQLKLKRVFWEVFEEYNYDHDITNNIHKHQQVIQQSFGIDTDTMDSSSMLKQFVKVCGLPTTLGEIKINESNFDDIIDSCMRSRLLEQNCVPINSDNDVRDILNMAK